MKFFVYFIFAISPLVATILHDVLMDHGKASLFLPLGYYIYNYLPDFFNIIRSTFIDSDLRVFVSILMKTPLLVYSGLFSLSVSGFLVHCYLNNSGPFRDYLEGIPQLEKKWLTKDKLNARFSGTKTPPAKNTQKK
tara:strand:- start:148205 stop:148612 length:408 start_codon:yes stop_codon:yes gene_type:complete